MIQMRAIVACIYLLQQTAAHLTCNLLDWAMLGLGGRLPLSPRPFLIRPRRVAVRAWLLSSVDCGVSLIAECPPLSKCQ
jgi:hypothetical protein